MHTIPKLECLLDCGVTTILSINECRLGYTLIYSTRINLQEIGVDRGFLLCHLLVWKVPSNINS